MTLQLKKSQVNALPYDFEQAVRDFIAAKEEHRFTGDAAPGADAIVEAAVKRIQYPIDAGKPDDFVADYEIEDDTPATAPPPHPAPPLTLEQRKQALVVESRMREQAEMAALIPAGKRRVLDIECQRAAAIPETERSPDQQRIIEQHRALRKQLEEIAYAAALREAEIDDISE